MRSNGREISILRHSNPKGRKRQLAKSYKEQTATYKVPASSIMQRESIHHGLPQLGN